MGAKPGSKDVAYKVRLAECQNWRCAYCCGEMCYDQITLDHVVSRRHKGANTWGNLVIACQPCNEAKSHTNAYRFYKLRQRGLDDGWWPALAEPGPDALKHLRALWRGSAQ